MGGRRGVDCSPADINDPSIVAQAGLEGRSLPTSKGALLFGSIWSISVMNLEETGAIRLLLSASRLAQGCILRVLIDAKSIPLSSEAGSSTGAVWCVSPADLEGRWQPV